MSIAMTWRNIFVMVGLAAGLFSALVAGTGVAIQWRIDAIQSQLDDRMKMYERETDRILRRLDKLEEK